MNQAIMMPIHPVSTGDAAGDTVLIVGHGSREDSGNQEIRDFTDQWRARRPDLRIELCFIEFAPATSRWRVRKPSKARDKPARRPKSCSRRT